MVMLLLLLLLVACSNAAGSIVGLSIIKDSVWDTDLPSTAIFIISSGEVESL